MNSLVIQFKTDSQNRISNFILPLSDVEKGLAKVSAMIEILSDMVIIVVFVAVVIQALAKPPACHPSFFVSIGST